MAEMHLGIVRHGMSEDPVCVDVVGAPLYVCEFKVFSTSSVALHDLLGCVYASVWLHSRTEVARARYPPLSVHANAWRVRALC